MSVRKSLEKVDPKKYWINTLFPLIGIVIILLYSVCGDACSFLRGSIFSIDLKYLGILYMGLLIISNILKRTTIFLFLLSFGIGAEIYLIGFQIKNLINCYYCFAFGAVVLILFLLNLDMSKKVFIGIFLILGFVLFSIFFQGIVTPLYADDPPKVELLPSFGNGKTKIRLYTDYFCGPCKSIEARLEKVIPDLVKKGIINITFVDTPIHEHTNIYARYFLYVLNGKNELNNALHARAALFEAASMKILGEEKLKEFLKKRNIGFRPFDERPTFNLLNSYLREDRVDATPTCVIYNGVKKRYKGAEDIIKALESLSPPSSSK